MASNLLRNSRAPIMSIALEAGYESVAAFTREFNRLARVPPEAWLRDQNKEPTNCANRKSYKTCPKKIYSSMLIYFDLIYQPQF